MFSFLCRKITLLVMLSFLVMSLAAYFISFPYIERTVRPEFISAYELLVMLVVVFFHLLILITLSAIKAYLNNIPRISTEFLSNISHEIRTPMNAIIGSANLLMNEPLKPVHHKFIKSIAQSGSNILTIANEVLDYSKIRANKKEINKEVFELYDEIQSIYTVFKPLAEEKGLNLKLKSDKLPLAVVGDPGALIQILTNFINNAIKFTPSGSITLSVEVEKASKESVQVKFVVTDTGIGIAEKEQKKIFDIYEQVSGTAIMKASGTGLGLYISKYLAEAMGGTISFESEEGKGTSFWLSISFPVASVEECVSLVFKDSIVEFPMFEAKVLLVEDSMTNNFIITSILEKIGCDVDSVTDGKQAVDKVASNNYDLIFMDRIMPVMNGLEATKTIRKTEDEKSRNIIVALTAGVFLEEKDSCIEAGMDSVLSKPVVIKDFVEVFNQYIPDLKTKEAVYISEGDFISWSDKLSLDIESIDSQHKNICKYINMLYRAKNESSEPDVTGQILSNLLEYTVVHFDYEEKYFKEFNYENEKEHCASHKKLKDNVVEYSQKYKSGEDVSEELFVFLKGWLVNHILIEDSLYVNCFKEHGLK